MIISSHLKVLPVLKVVKLAEMNLKTLSFKIIYAYKIKHKNGQNLTHQNKNNSLFVKKKWSKIFTVSELKKLTNLF